MLIIISGGVWSPEIITSIGILDMNIPEPIIEQLNSQADLVGIIGKHTTLKAAGREYKGCCPFHGEKRLPFMSILKPTYIIALAVMPGQSDHF